MILLIMPQQVVISEKDVVNGRAFPTMLAYLMMAMSLLMTGTELVKLITKKPLTMKTVNALAEVKALTIIVILLVTYLLAKVTDLFVIGGLFCAVAFLVYFRCKKKSYYRVKGSGTYFHKDQALSRELSDKNAKCKIGLILQGQDPNANSKLIDGIRSVLAEQWVDLHIFLTDNKFSNERRCLQTVVHQNFQGFIVDIKLRELITSHRIKLIMQHGTTVSIAKSFPNTIFQHGDKILIHATKVKYEIIMENLFQMIFFHRKYQNWSDLVKVFVSLLRDLDE